MTVRTIATDLKLTGEKEFNDQLKAVNSGTKALRAEMGAVTSEFGKNDASMSQHIRVSKNLKEQNKQQEEIIRAATIALKQNEDAYGKDSKQADKFRTIIASAKTQINKNNAELEKHNVALKAMHASGKAAGTTMKGVGKALGAVGSAAGSSVKAIGKLSALSMAAAGALATAGVAGLKMMTDYAKQAAEAANAAAEAGEPLTESQQQWLVFSDQLGNLDAAAQSTKAALGGVLLPALGDLSEVGAQFLQDFSRDMEAASGDTEKQGQVMAEYIGKGAKLIKQKLPEYIAVGKELLQGLGEGLADEGPELLDMMFDLLMDLLDGIIDFAPQMGEGAIKLAQALIQGLADKGPDLLTSAVRMVTDLVRGLAQGAPDMIPAAANLVVTLITALVEAAPDLLLAGLEMIYGIISGLVDGLGNIIDAAGDIINTLIDAFAAKGEDFAEIGSDIIKKIKEGIKAAWDGLVSWFTDLWDSLFGNRDVNVSVNKSTSGASSVSGYSSSGFSYAASDELIKKLRIVNKALVDSVDTSFDIPSFGPKRPTGRYYATRQGNVINLYFSAKQITQSDIEMICDTVNRKLGDAI